MTDKQTVKFGDICREVKLTTKDPLADGYERYIGLEHLDSGSLKIKRWGMIAEDNPSFNRVFKKGHILFGKRRPYLKKAAIAEFDGICSGDIIVLEPKSTLCVPELLPFLIHTETFWSWAIKTSSGSLSPRTKFASLSGCLINIPNNKKRQSNYLSLLIKIQAAISLAEDALEKANLLHEVLGLERFNNNLGIVSLNELCTKIQDGTHFSPQKICAVGEFQYVTSKNIRMGRMEFSAKEYISREEHEKIYSRCDVRKGDILLTKDGANTGNVCINEIKEEISLLSSVAFLRVNREKADANFIYYWLMSKATQRDISSQMAGNAITRLTLEKIKSLKVPIFKPEEQKQIGDLLAESHSSIDLIENKIKKLQQLNASILENGAN